MSTTDLHDGRRDYAGQVLPDEIADPWTFFGTWFEQARAEEEAGRLEEASAMVLATVDEDGQPSSRVVLAKAFGPELGDHGGVDFYSSGESRKGRAMAAHRQVALLFFWPSLNRQVRLEGSVEVLPVAQAEAYFARRPFASQVAAVVSQQSRPRASRRSLEDEYAAATQRFGQGPVPRPEDWYGYRVHPHRIEFWQGLPGRLHDRVECVLGPDGWSTQRLDP